MNNELKNDGNTLFGAITAITKELVGVSFLFFLFIPTLFAPMLGYYVRGNLMATYNISNPNDGVIKAKMLPVWIFLWAVCIFAWCLVGYVCVSDKGCGFQ